MSNSKLWGGRFGAATNQLIEAFNASINFDITLASEDITASQAHARMLGRVGVLSHQETAAIVDGLEQVGKEIATGQLELSDALEDIHMHVEHRLTQLIGELGKKLHTARSRNDQVATDMRLWLRNRMDELAGQMRQLMHALLELAEREQATLLPGFTHLQVAQPISFAQHLLAWFGMLKRDYQRLHDCRARVNLLPLGAAALAGTGYPIDRTWVAQQLGFEGVMANSLDAVSDRDFAIEFCACAATCMMHLSRWSEELVLWSSQLTGFIDLPDSMCTGSSIMPQKKNPDIPELIRGKSARVMGDLQTLLCLMKSQPLAYNKDNQEDKPPLFASVATLQQCLEIMALLIPGITTNPQRMRAAFVGSYANATDLADYLVGKGLAFRDAHAQTGALVQYALQQGKDIEELDLASIQQHCPLANQDLYQAITLEQVVARRTSPGGTAPQQVTRQLADAHAWLEQQGK